MEITRLNEDTMECSLTAAELEERGISLDEVTYSSPVIRKLIHDLAVFLAKKHMFGSSSSPSVASEIIPLDDGGLCILFSKGDYSNDMDPRYSVFSAAYDCEPSDDNTEADDAPADAIDIFRSILEGDISKSEEEKYLYQSENDDPSVTDYMAVFEFNSLEDTLHALFQVFGFTEIVVRVYRSPAGVYLAVLHFYNLEKGMVTDIADFLTDYGQRREVNSGSELYIQEHCEEIIPMMALFILKFIFRVN
jgi:negative regulator of genetic competence, sporulation and motility